jgi:integrase
MPAQKAQEFRRATLGQYQGVIDNWIGPRLGGTKVAPLTPATVVECMTALRSEPSAHGRPGLSARSTQLSVGILKSACSWAVGAELVGRTPNATVRPPRAQAQAKAAALPPIRLHDTRQTAASLMLADGVPTKVVTEILGHASPVITLLVYAHVLPGMAEEAGERLSAQLFG